MQGLESVTRTVALQHKVQSFAAAILISMFLLPVLAVGAVDESDDDSSGEASAPQEPEAKFDIFEYQVEGNTTLPNLAIERAVYPFLGPARGASDVEKARQALERAYNGAGYLTVTVGIPEQKVENGVVRLAVFEGRVERLKITGARYFSQGYIRAKVPEFAEDNVPEFTAVQQQLGDLARAQDRRVTPVMKPGRSPGMLDVELKVADKIPLHGGVELNNRYTANTEPLRLSAYVRYDNLWQREHSMSLQVLTSPQDLSQVRVFSGTYVLPAGPGKNVLALYGVRSQSDVAAASNLTVVGRGSIVGARYIIPLRATTTVGHSFTLGVDYKDFTDSVNLIGADTQTSPISYTPMSAQYNASRVGERGVTKGIVSANFAMRGMFGNRDVEFANRRFNARSNYFYVRAELSREQVMRNRFSLFGRIMGQTSSQPLISTEQFFAGGVESVRGYLEAEALGDDALGGRLELRTPSFSKALGNSINEVVAHTFFDYAEVRIQEPLPDQQVRYRLSSAGVGLRAKGLDNLSASLDLAFPFESTQRTQAGDARLQFRVAYDF